MLSWGFSWTWEGSSSSSTKWRRDSTSLLVKVSTGFRSSTTRSDGGEQRREKRVHRSSMFGDGRGMKAQNSINRVKEQIPRQPSEVEAATMCVSHQSKF